MSLDTTPTSLIVKANLYNFSVEEKQRREAALVNKDYYYSRQENYVECVNTEVTPVTLPLTNAIIKKKSNLLYSRPLVREFIGPNQSVNFITDFLSYTDIDFLLSKADLASELTGTALVYIGIDESGKTLLRLYDASEFSVLQDENNPDIPTAISLISVITKVSGSEKDPDAKRYLKSEVWTNSYISSFQDGVRQSSEANELGYLPFTVFKGEEVYGQILGHAPATAIRQLNHYINQQLTNLGYMIKMQSATPIVLTGFQQGEGVVVHPGKAISLPAGASAGVLSLNPAIKDTIDEIKYLEEKIYETSSIPKISVVGDDNLSTSGKELLVKWAPILQVFKQKSLRYKKYELDLFNMILKVNKMEPLVDINTKYPEESILPYSPETENLEQNIKLGITTPVDELMKINPTLNETDAEAMVRANLEFNKLVPTNPGGLNGRKDSNTNPAQ